MKIDILYFPDCPHHRAAFERVHEALRAESLSAAVSEIEVSGADAAQRIKFLGSPSIRVDGLDIEPEARSATQFGRSRCFPITREQWRAWWSVSPPQSAQPARPLS